MWEPEFGTIGRSQGGSHRLVCYGMMWTVDCHILARAAIYRRTLCINHSSLIIPFPLFSTGSLTPCPQSLPRLPPIPTLPPFSTLLWKNTNVRPSKTSPSIPSFPGFNPVIPPKPSSPSFESKPRSSINPRIATIGSRDGSPRL
jgi:hypothetical protein